MSSNRRSGGLQAQRTRRLRSGCSWRTISPVVVVGGQERRERTGMSSTRSGPGCDHPPPPIAASANFLASGFSWPVPGLWHVSMHATKLALFPGQSRRNGILLQSADALESVPR